MENLAMGFQLMLIGMVTVFMILMIVIYGSKLLISVINRIAPEEVKKEKSSSEGEVPMAILQEAVKQLTGGKGHIVNLTRIN